MKNLNSKLVAVVSALAASVIAGSAFALAPTAGDLSAMTPDFATVITAIGAVAGVIIGVILALVGFRKVKGMLNRA